MLVCGGIFARRAVFLTRLVLDAKPSDRPGDVQERVVAEAEIVLGQKKLLQRLVPGLMHAFIFWGFIVLFPTIILAAIDVAGGHVGTPEWYRVLSDVFAVLVLVGVVDGARYPHGGAAGAVRRARTSARGISSSG